MVSMIILKENYLTLLMDFEDDIVDSNGNIIGGKVYVLVLVIILLYH